MPSVAPLDLSSLSHYKRIIPLPTSSRNPVVAKLLTRYHCSTKHSEQATLCLQLANHYFTSERFRHALPYYAASLSHTVQCQSQHDIFPVLTLLRRLGECHHQLQHHSSAANAFNTALALLAQLCPGSAMTKKYWTFKQEVLLSLGNSYQDWCDAEEEKGYTAGRPLALKAKDAHYESLMVARRLCGMDKSSKEVAGAAEVAEETVRDRAITNMQATVLARAYINLANTLTQLLHYENVEREARKRVAATTAHIDSTDSSSSSSSSLDDSNEPSLASTLSSLATLSLAAPSSGVSLSSLAASLYSSALSLAISHNLVEEEQRVYSNRSTLWEEDGQWQEAEDDLKHELKLARKRKHKPNGKHAAPSTADVIEQAACRARLMTLAVKAGRYEQAVKEAKERRRMVVAAGVEEEEAERAEEELELMEEIRHNIRLKQTTQQLLDDMEDELDDSKYERANKRRRVDQLAVENGNADASMQESAASQHVRLLHRHIDVCLALAERNVNCHNNYAAALASHQHALSLLASLQSCSTAATLTLAVHSYHLYTITRYLPWLLPQQHSPDEVQRWLATAHATLEVCRPLARGADRGLLALLECHLMEESGVECDELLRVLQCAVEAVEAVEREGANMIIRGQLLREQWHVLDLIDEEEGEADETQQAAVVAEGESEVKRARRARRKVQRMLLKGQMEVVQRWAARHEEEANKQRAHIKCGLWMLDAGQLELDDRKAIYPADSGTYSQSGSAIRLD